MMQYPLVFVHGWGTTPDVWHGIVRHLGQQDAIFVNLYQPSPPLPSHFIGVGHSLGVWWLLQQQGCMALASFAGFKGFCQPHGPKPRRIVERMAKRFGESPQLVLNEFSKSCGSAPPVRPGAEYYAALYDWLLHLQDLYHIGAEPPVCQHWHGTADAVLPLVAARQWRKPSLVAGAGHDMIWRNPAWCAEQIRKIQQLVVSSGMPLAAVS